MARVSIEKGRLSGTALLEPAVGQMITADNLVIAMDRAPRGSAPCCGRIWDRCVLNEHPHISRKHENGRIVRHSDFACSVSNLRSLIFLHDGAGQDINLTGIELVAAR